MPTVLITGGTGTVGKRLTELLLLKGYDVNILSRSNLNLSPSDGKMDLNNQSKRSGENYVGKIAYYNWDLANNFLDPAAINGADFIVHLAGAGVADKRWTEQRKKEIADSRITSSALIVSALKNTPNHITAVISASAIGWYGPDEHSQTHQPFEETDTAYPDFLGKTCQLWEESITPVITLGKRLVILRTGIVLSNDGGALVEFKKPLLFKTAAILGNGKQMISWIHIDDLCNQFIYAIENQMMNGVYNAVAPKPVDNATLTLTLARKICGHFFVKVHVPAFVLKIMLGEMSIEVLKSTTVSAKKMQEAGFQFHYPEIDKAVDALAK